MKKIFKRISAAVMAVCMSAAVAVPFGNASITADAGTDLLGDVNGDGAIDMVDLLILQNYLLGKCEITRYGAADLDYDSVITMADVSKLSRYLANMIKLPTNINDITIANMDSNRFYVMHNYKTNRNRLYNLKDNVDKFSLEDGISTYADNIDDRVRATDTSVVQISSIGGTGFIIGDHLIATAAHCVYNSSTMSFIDDLTVVIRGEPYSNTSRVLATCKAVEAHVPRDFIYDPSITDPSLITSMYDYALIYVEEDLSEYGKFDLGIPSDEFMNLQPTVTVSGFPDGTQSNPSANNQALYKADGVMLNTYRYTNVDNDYIGNGQKKRNFFDYQVMLNAYTSGGNSGGPIYITSYFAGEEYRTVVGILTSGGTFRREGERVAKQTSFGVRTTTSLLRFYYNNNYIGSSAT
ncbi:MAG: trypsin-like peptidase domain-containing protein [Ruminococcus sp.]|nr:trypsin-like peptidase domain-containing protein [Ruminococcus sp.]